MTEAPEAPAKKKPFEKRYKTVVPIPLPAGVDRPDTIDEATHQDFAIARWLGRESFENTAAGDRLDLVEYSERLIPLDEVDPRLADVLSGPIDSFVWFGFEGLGRLDQDAFDYFAAEFKWKCDEWLAAEAAHLDALDASDDQE